MEVNIDVPVYHPDRGLHFSWEEGFEIEVGVDSQDILIRANRAGLISVARHLLTLAQDEVPAGSHMHLTAGQEVESDIDLVIERAAD